MLSVIEKTSKVQFEKITGLCIEKKIASGNGTIYSLKGEPDKVVKIAFSYEGTYSKKMMKLLKSLKKIKSPAVVNIYQYGSFLVNREPYYYYVMDKLSPIPNKWNAGDLIQEYLSGERMPAKESGRIKSFVRKARKINERYYYADVHGGNIMKTKRGALKFVDLESFTYSY